MGVGFETTTGPSGPSRSRETWHVLFSFTNERGEICDLTSNRVPHVFLKGCFFGNPPKKMEMAQKIHFWRLGVKKEKHGPFLGSLFHLSFWGRKPDLDLGSTRDWLTVKSLKEVTSYTPKHFTANKKPQKNGTSPISETRVRLPFASNLQGLCEKFWGCTFS